MLSPEEGRFFRKRAPGPEKDLSGQTLSPIVHPNEEVKKKTGGFPFPADGRS